MTKRNILFVLLVGFVTCGIYSLYWFYVTSNQLNKKSGKKLPNFIIALLLGIVTFGIYLVYWLYLFYKKLDAVTKKDLLIINLLLTIFATPVVGSTFAQYQIN